MTERIVSRGPPGSVLRIAVVAACPFPWPRGTPIRIHRIAEAMAARGHDVHVATYHLGQRPVDPGFSIHRIPEVRGYTKTSPGPSVRKLVQLDPMLIARLRALHRKIAFHAIHAHHYEGLLAALLAGIPVPIIYDAHTMLGGELPSYQMIPPGLACTIGRWIDRRLPGRASHTVAVSRSIRDQLVAMKAVPADRISVIPNGVEWERFPLPSRETQEIETVIFTGNLGSYQGIDLMLQAFAVLRARRPNVELSIVTESPFDPYEAQAKKLGVREAIRVQPAPFAEQPALLSRANVALSPRTQCDGIPQKLLNYMAAGVPIVAFQGSAVTLKHERTGLCVVDGDTEGMAGAIERLLDDRALAHRLGESAREEARREHSWARVAERIEGVIRAQIESHAAR